MRFSRSISTPATRPSIACRGLTPIGEIWRPGRLILRISSSSTASIGYSCSAIAVRSIWPRLRWPSGWAWRCSCSRKAICGRITSPWSRAASTRTPLCRAIRCSTASTSRPSPTIRRRSGGYFATWRGTRRGTPSFPGSVVGASPITSITARSIRSSKQGAGFAPAGSSWFIACWTSASPASSSARRPGRSSWCRCRCIATRRSPTIRRMSRWSRSFGR